MQIDPVCGIFALFLNRRLSDSDIRLGRSGTKALAYRGPDGCGEWVDAESGVYIGHRRLAIVDLSDASAQPMVRDGAVLAYNGQIYNFRALRERLEARGVHFSTTGDAEVFLRSLQAWGSGALDVIDGMFAFVFWKDQRALLGVDPFGEKPLFWAETNEGVYVCSEIAPLAQLLDLEPETSPQLWAAYFSLGHFPAPGTAYRGVNKLPPASLLTVECGRMRRRDQYWIAPVAEAGRGPVKPLSESNLTRIAAVLVESLQRRLIADVPLTLFLSSGVDSTLVAAIAKRELAANLNAVTVSFPRGRVTNEAPRASKTAGYLGLEHCVIESNDDPALVSPDAVIDLFGQPCDAITTFAIRQISKAVAAHFKVAVTGMGGDELSWGYGKHELAWRRRMFFIPPDTFRRTVINAVTRLTGGVEPMQQLRDLVAVRDEERYVALKSFPTIGWLRRLPHFNTWTKATFTAFNSPLYAIVAAYELRRGLADEHLYAYDLASMRESVELRTPFLSRELAEVMAQFDPRAFVAFGQKNVLRRLLARYVPTQFFNYPKAGFVFPADVFLQNCGAAPPDLPCLPHALVKEAWKRRNEGLGWSRIGVRLATAGAFFGRAPGSRDRAISIRTHW